MQCKKRLTLRQLFCCSKGNSKYWRFDSFAEKSPSQNTEEFLIEEIILELPLILIFCY